MTVELFVGERLSFSCQTGVKRTEPESTDRADVARTARPGWRQGRPDLGYAITRANGRS